MDKEGKKIVDAAVATLNELGLKASVKRATGARNRADAIVVLRHDGKTMRYRAEIRRRLTPSLVGPIALALSQDAEERLLITDHATAPVAEALRQRGVQFVDAAGNVFLKRRGMLVFVTGRSPRVITPARTLRVFRPSGLKILFALLSVRDLVSAPQRKIAQSSGVSLGSVAPVIDGLRTLGFVADIRGTRRIVNRERLLDQWTEGYVRLLQPSLQLGRFSVSSPDWWRRADVTRYGAQWGGETAAALLHRHLVPEETIVYVDAIPARLLSQERLKADPNGRVVFRRRFWNAVPSPREDVVPPLLIYADLLAAGDARSVDAAKQIRDGYLV
ncbi:MAG TPA: type IV toxin-antitoxin system AbiEi family antitoxin [Thermoanaerobaculia bacterium]|nr:type IV toxin-antitoxin system AbiEi family antitoxin [Thermoanaerobaculia bacterium]